MVLRGNLRGIFSFILGLALLGALWNASLYLLSSQESATGILTDVGIQVINPVLTKSRIGGLSQSALTSIAKNCASRATVPGLKVAVDCSKLKNATNLDAATLVVYQAVADSYYYNGIGGIFAANVPQPVVDLLSGKSILPTINTVNLPNGKSVSVPHFPDNPLFQLGSAVGLSFSTLTLQGHNDARTRTLWFGGLALALLLVIGLTSKGGKRLTAMGHALIGGAFPGVLGIGLVWFLTTRYATQAASFTVLLNYLGKAFIPVYVGAALVGVLLYVVAFAWRMVAKSVSVGEKKPEAARVGAAARPRAEIGGSFGGVGGYPAPRPRYAPQSPAPGSNGPQYQPRYPNADPWSQPQQPPRQPTAGPTWPQPQSPSWDNGPTQAYPPQAYPPAGGGAPYAPQGGRPYAQGGPPYAQGDGQYPGRPGYPAGPSTPGTPGSRAYQRPEPPRSPRPDAGWGDQQGSGWGEQQGSGWGEQQGSGWGEQQSSGWGEQQSSGWDNDDGWPPLR
jgi:hypothetical protein